VHERRGPRSDRFLTSAERGTALIEFALVLPVLAVLTFGSVDLARGYGAYERAHNAAREAAFFAATHPGQLHNYANTACADPNNADWHGNNEDSQTFTFVYSSDVTSCVTTPSSLPSTSSAGKPLKVTAKISMTPITPFISQILGNSIPISASVCVNLGAGAPSATSCP
jgi:Flp pilus assembly protein TadG